MINKRVLLAFSFALVFVMGGLLTLNLKDATAAYNGNNIVDNGTFLNANSMSASDIQNFLANKGSGLASRSFALPCYGAGSRERQLYTSVGGTCDTNVPASHVIYYASRVYGVNPQVILAMLQKEQSLVTTGNPTIWQLTQAMGYACPTTGSCDTSSSFPWQIDNGTWALRYHYERANGNNNWWTPSSGWVCGTEKNFYKPNLYPGQNVRFYDGNNVHYRTHYIENAATSAFYCYTPHAYNNPQGLYGRAAYGTTGQYYSGSYNFVAAFESWFGSTQSNDTAQAHPNGTLVSDGQYVYKIDNGTRRHISAAAFRAYGYDWNRVKPVTTGDRNLPAGDPLWAVPAGTVFTYNDGKVYVADDRSGTLKKQWVSAATFNKLGYQWSEVINANSAQEVPSITEPGFLDDTRHPSGATVVIDGKVYYIDKYTKRYVSGVAFNTNYLRWGMVVGALNGDKSLYEGSGLSFPTGTLLYSGGNIYATDIDGSGVFKRPIGPWECFSDRFHFSHTDWFEVAPSALPARTGPLLTC